MLCSLTPLLKAGAGRSHCSGSFPISFRASPRKKTEDPWDTIPMFGHIFFSPHASSCIWPRAHCLLPCPHSPENRFPSPLVRLSHPTRTLYTLIRYPDPSLLQAKQSQTLCPCMTDAPSFKVLISFLAPHWSHLSRPMCFFVLVSTELDTVFQVCLANAEYRERITLLYLQCPS